MARQSIMRRLRWCLLRQAQFGVEDGNPETAIVPKSANVAADLKKWFIHRTAQCAGDKVLREIHGMIYHLCASPARPWVL